MTHAALTLIADCPVTMLSAQAVSRWPQFIIVGAYAANFMNACIKAGSTDRAGPIVIDVVTTALSAFVLYSGGFWAPLGWSP